MKNLLKKSFALLFLFTLLCCGRCKCRQRNLVQRGRSGSNPKNTIPSKDNQKPEVAPKATAGKDNQKPEVAPKATAGKDNQKPEVAPKATAGKDNQKPEVAPKATVGKDNQKPEVAPKATVDNDLDQGQKPSQEANSLSLNNESEPSKKLNKAFEELKKEPIPGKSRTWWSIESGTYKKRESLLGYQYDKAKKELQEANKKVEDELKQEEEVYRNLLTNLLKQKEKVDKSNQELKDRESYLEKPIPKGYEVKGQDKNKDTYYRNDKVWRLKENFLTQKLNALEEKNKEVQQVLSEIRLLKEQKKELDGELEKLEEGYKEMKQWIRD